MNVQIIEGIKIEIILKKRLTVQFFSEVYSASIPNSDLPKMAKMEKWRKIK
jgi:hypothetical protein